MPYVPHRKKEGYGFSIKGIDNVKKQFNPSLIISVDHGITAKEKITYAKRVGVPIIVTDHHLKPEKLPDDALAIFHIPELSGSGVAYFFAKAIFEHFKRQSTINNQQLTINFQTDYLALASIGSIADLVPLTGPTRSVVKYGLEAFTSIKRAGIKHLIDQAGITGKKITPYEVGFIIAPRINAVGRLEHAIDALRLLCTTNNDQAFNLASRVGETNRERQDMVIKAVEEAKTTIEKEYDYSSSEEGRDESRSSRQARTLKKLPKLIILKNKNWHEGIIGLIASKIAEEYFRPVIIITESDGFLKGSARSIPSFHITNFLRDLKKYLVDVGGHKGAAGFTMEKSKFTTFSATAFKVANKLIKNKDLERVIEADIKIPVSKLNISIAKTLEQLQPFGIGNPKPTFYSEVEILDVKSFGKSSDHLKILVKDASQQSTINNYQLPIELISFGTAKKYSSLIKGQKIIVVYSIEIDRWNGYEKLRGKIVSIL